MLIGIVALKWFKSLRGTQIMSFWAGRCFVLRFIEGKACTASEDHHQGATWSHCRSAMTEMAQLNYRVCVWSVSRQVV